MNTMRIEVQSGSAALPLLPQPFPARLPRLMLAILAAPLVLAVLAVAALNRGVAALLAHPGAGAGASLPLLPHGLGARGMAVLALILLVPGALLVVAIGGAAHAVATLRFCVRYPAATFRALRSRRSHPRSVLRHQATLDAGEVFRFDRQRDDVFARSA